MGGRVEDALGHEAGRSWCPHLAMLIESPDQLHASLAAFYRLGAGRNGWILHRSFPDHEARDRAGLEAAACECYGTVRRQFERLPGGAPATGA